MSLREELEKIITDKQLVDQALDLIKRKLPDKKEIVEANGLPLEVKGVKTGADDIRTVLRAQGFNKAIDDMKEVLS